MSATVSLPPDVAGYLARVRGALGDLPAEERDELLADVEASLLEAAADSVEPLEQRLGPPGRFASELRAAAGLEVREPTPDRFEPASELRAAAGLEVREPTPDRFEQLRALAARVTPVARELAPIWWLARAYVLVALLTLLAGDDHWARTVVPDLFGMPLSVAVLAAAALGSIWLGIRSRSGSRRSVLALNVVLAIASLPVAMQILTAPQSVAVVYAEPQPVPQGVVHLGEPVTNLYAYGRDGRRLVDVLLYDQLGRPLDIGSPDPALDPQRRRVRAASGEDLLNVFPIRYLEPGTNRVADPGAGPPIDVPKIITPPLRKRR